MDITNRGSLNDLFEKVAKSARKGKYLTKDKYEKLRAKVSQEVIKAIEVNNFKCCVNLNRMELLTLSEKTSTTYLCIIFLMKSSNKLACKLCADFKYDCSYYLNIVFSSL
jgi:hypothetical protein